MRAQRVRGGESRVEMQFAKWTAEGAVAVVISIGSISAYKYITSPKEGEHPARDYTGRCCRADHTEDDHLRCIQEHKGNHPADQ